MMSRKILIVDDSLTVRMDLAEVLEQAGFTPVTAKTASEARAMAAELDVELIVLDVILPDGDGVELLKEFRSDARLAKVPVLMLSTEAEVRDRIRGLNTGANDYVGKPYDSGYVVSRVRALTAAREDAEGSVRILIIDDSVTFREQLRAGLGEAGYRVLIAGNGEEGLRTAGTERPSAIIVDGVLPGIDGPTVIRRIRLDAALRGTPCILLTASGGSEVELDALDAGADAFVRKGEELGLILAKLSAVLRRAGSTGREMADSLLGPKKILAVDDSLTFLERLADVLRSEGYDVVLAHSGEEALELLAVEGVDCILLDLIMPGLGGKETCIRIKSAPVVRDTPLILLTAVDDEEMMIQGLSAGADDYISKSSEFDLLKARVRAQLRRRQFEDENRRIREELLRKELEVAEARAARDLAEARAQMAEELERKNQELEAFSSSVSHDLMAPLRAIDGFSQALIDDCGDQLSDQGKHYLMRLRGNATRMAELIHDLLKLSRVSLAELRRVRTDLSELARTVLGELQAKDPERQVEVVIANQVTADVDPGLMRAALENLLGNAWKFSGKTQAARIEFGVEQQGAERAYFVRDNGAGFDGTYVKDLFQPFKRLHTGAEFPGNGIGLATVRRIIEKHRGHIWAEGQVGAGATIYFTLRTTGDPSDISSLREGRMLSSRAEAAN